MEVMPQHQLLELKRIGTEYERMHANAILDDRSNGNTSNHGYPAITELMASTKGQRSVTGIPVKQNRYLQRIPPEQESETCLQSQSN